MDLAKEIITTKSTKETKWNSLKNFVIFVYFVVDKSYSMSLKLIVEQTREAGRNSING